MRFFDGSIDPFDDEREKMELRNLKSFLAVAKLAGFNRAAEQLHYAQSSISAQIKVLEEEIGRPLFLRQGKNVILTPAGSELLHYAQKMVDMEREALSSLTAVGQTRSRITLRMPQTLATCFLPRIIEKFRQDHEHVDFDVGGCAHDLLPQELTSGKADLAFLLTDSLDFSMLHSECLGIARLVLIVAPGHRLSTRSAVCISDLQGLPILYPKHDCSYRMYVGRMLAEERVESGAVIEMNSIEALKQCVMRDLGVAVLPHVALTDELLAGTLVALPFEVPLESAILMIHHREKWLSPLLKAFMETVRRVFFSPREAATDATEHRALHVIQDC